MANPRKFKSKLKFYNATTKQRKRNKCGRCVAAEIEVARVNTSIKYTPQILGLEKVVRKWNGSIVHDGSITYGGFEINTAPSSGDYFVRQVSEICSALKKVSAASNNSCGLHVHIDARDFNYDDLSRLIALYAVIESSLFKMIPSNRRDSIYARECGKKYVGIMRSCDTKTHLALKRAIVRNAYDDYDTEDYRHNKYGAGHGTSRYYALNLHSWFYRGTIEIRLLDGTLDPKEIITWGAMWGAILDHALNMSDEEVNKLIENSKSSYGLLTTLVKNIPGAIAMIDRRHKLHNLPMTRSKESAWADLA